LKGVEMMSNKLERAAKLIAMGYRVGYEKPVIPIPGISHSTIILTSPEGEEERIEFEGMDVSAADTFYYDFLTHGGFF
jgi:hypothetical protein